MMTSKPLVFFGSGPVAAKSLELLAQNFAIEAVITKPKPSHHRGNFPVLQMTKKLGLSTFYTADKNDLQQLFETHNFKSNVGVVIDYGIIIPKKIIDYFPLGIVNSHFSLLPQWRGADPITFAILSGQTKTGVSLMLIVEKMDEGPLLAQADYDIPSKITTPELTEALIDLSNQTLKEILPHYIEGKVDAAPQEQVTIAASAEPTYSRKLTKKDGEIRWSLPAEQIEREVRAFIEWPRSYTKIFDKDVIVTKAKEVPAKVEGHLIMETGDGLLEIEELIAPSGRKMSGAEFIRGYKRD